jgi:ubiquinone/menaquinone biosynthesis C-methylase UbiE
MTAPVRRPHWFRHLLGVSSEYREVVAMLPSVRALGDKLRARFPKAVVDELAIPSYTHGNPLMRHLFWQRLAVALEWVDSLAPAPRVVLDFGSGLGILTPALQRRAIRVIGCDIHPEVTIAGVKWLGGQSIDVIDAQNGLHQVSDQSVDAVLALDVLEHVEDPCQASVELARVLSAGGRLLWSLPTENTLYRLGRRLAGFSGGYHIQQAGAVVAAMRSSFQVRFVARLYPGLPFFDFYEAAHRDL